VSLRGSFACAADAREGCEASAKRRSDVRG
jgi:hypothetical protein